VGACALTVASALALSGCSSGGSSPNSAPATAAATETATADAAPATETPTASPAQGLEFRRVETSSVLGGLAPELPIAPEGAGAEATGSPTQPRASSSSADESIPQEVQREYDAYTCGQPVVAMSSDWLVACDRDEIKYVLKPAEFVAAVSAADAVKVNGVSWAVSVSLDASSDAALTDLSRQLVDTDQRVAVYVGGSVLTATTFSGVLFGGEFQISGDFDKNSARELAQELAQAM
jgi:hypothetical protein